MEILNKAFPGVVWKTYTRKSENKGGKSITRIRITRREDLSKVARLMLWALEYDGSEWGIEPQYPVLFLPRRKLAVLKRLARLSVDDSCNNNNYGVYDNDNDDDGDDDVDIPLLLCPNSSSDGDSNDEHFIAQAAESE